MDQSENHIDVNADSPSERLVMHYMAPVRELFTLPGVTSIAVNRFDQIFIRQYGEWILTQARFENEDALRLAIEQIMHSLGQKIDRLSPVADGRLADGSRVNAVLYPVAHRGSNMTIRLFPKVRFTIEDLLGKGAFSEEMMRIFKLAVACRYNILVSGATGSGKSTILNALANLTGERERIGVIEDTAELDIKRPNLVAMEAPKRSLTARDGSQVVTMESLLVNTLRQELSTVIVGEVRDPAAATALMLALNTGHEGVLSTIHANTPKKALRRLINMLLSNDTRIPYEAVATEIHDNFNLIIQCERTPQDGQRVVEVAELNEEGKLQTLFVWDYLERKHKRVYGNDSPPKLFRLAEKYGITVGNFLKE